MTCIYLTKYLDGGRHKVPLWQDRTFLTVKRARGSTGQQNTSEKGGPRRYWDKKQGLVVHMHRSISGLLCFVPFFFKGFFPFEKDTVSPPIPPLSLPRQTPTPSYIHDFSFYSYYCDICVYVCMIIYYIFMLICPYFMAVHMRLVYLFSQE